MSTENKAAIQLFIAEVIKRLQSDAAQPETDSTAAKVHAALTRYALVRFRQLADAVMQEWK